MPYRPKNSKYWYASFTDEHSNRIRRSTGTKDLEEAQALEEKWNLESHHKKNWGEKRQVDYEWRQLVEDAIRDHSSWLHRIKHRIRTKRTKKKFNGRTIDFTELVALALRSNGKCAVTGVKFSFKKSKDGKKPFMPSIDRIDCSKGYVRGNCRFVCFAVNVAILSWGEEVLLIIGSSLASKWITSHANEICKLQNPNQEYDED